MDYYTAVYYTIYSYYFIMSLSHEPHVYVSKSEFSEKYNDRENRIWSAKIDAIIKKHLPEITMVLLLTTHDEWQEIVRYNILKVLNEHGNK